jgi:hypothetical protein
MDYDQGSFILVFISIPKLILSIFCAFILYLPLIQIFIVPFSLIIFLAYSSPIFNQRRQWFMFIEKIILQTFNLFIFLIN